MKTEVRKEYGDWIVFVDDSPQFSFMYREEAEKARNMVDALAEANKVLEDLRIMPSELKKTFALKEQIEQALTDMDVKS